MMQVDVLKKVPQSFELVATADFNLKNNLVSVKAIRRD